MNPNSNAAAAADIGPSVSGIARFVLRRLIRGIEAGRLCIVTPAGERIEHRALLPGPEAVLILHSWRALTRLISEGDIGFAEAYIAGEWSSPDLLAVIAVAACNQDRLERLNAGILPVRLFRRLRHGLRANSRRGSRRNIAFHYDLGNAFYRQWLDPSMTYSSALYSDEGQSLESAQEAKLARIVDLLELDAASRVLEIGCGWGTLAARLARQGAEVTALTLSTEQLAHASALIGQESLGHAVDLRLQDYRDAGGDYDRIVSIEMLEAVGEAYWPVYFKTLRERLLPGGRVVLQAITIDESRFEAYRRTPDFIQRYVFPGGMLPSKTVLAEQATKAGLALVASETFGGSYARTLAEWRRRFLAAWPAIEPLGFDAPFRRLWEYYLCYCQVGFETGAIDVGLYVLQG